MNRVFPERIAQARELAGFTKTQLAEDLGLSVAAVTQWENGSKSATPENLQAVASRLQVPLEMFLTPIPDEILRHGPLTFRAKEQSKTTRFRRQARRFAEVV